MENRKLYLFASVLFLIFLFASSSMFCGCKQLQPWQETISKASGGDEIPLEELTIAKTSNSQKDTDSTIENNIDSNKLPQKYAIIASGASNDSQHYKWFLNSTGMAYDLLRKNGYSDKNIFYLFESNKEQLVDFEASISNFKKVTRNLQKITNKTDTILLFLIGHGTCLGVNSYYTLNDYNLSDAEMAEMFKPIKIAGLVFVFSSCNSGGFIDDLSSENTVVITSTQKDEVNRAAFIEPLLTSFNGTGDSNSDGKVSFAEAFNYASENVKDQYIDNNWGQLTEHALIDGNGDKIGHEAPFSNMAEGDLAENIYLK